MTKACGCPQIFHERVPLGCSGTEPEGRPFEEGQALGHGPVAKRVERRHGA
jgi:hypothetical protein